MSGRRLPAAPSRPVATFQDRFNTMYSYSPDWHILWTCLAIALTCRQKSSVNCAVPRIFVPFHVNSGRFGASGRSPLGTMLLGATGALGHSVGAERGAAARPATRGSHTPKINSE